MLSRDRVAAIAREMADRSPGDGFVVLDRTLTIRAVSAAYGQATLRDREELTGQFMFDAFPDNPQDPQANGTARLAASLEATMRDEQRHDMWIQRYDIPDPTAPGEFLPKVWSPSNSPLVDHGELIGVVHRCGSEISDVSQALAVITQVSTVAGELPPSEVLHTLTAVVEAHDIRYRIEIEQLRNAIETRDIIGQAKGILMERFSMDASAAFDLLVTFSQKSNTRVAEVARKLVDIEHPHTAGESS